MGNCRWRDQTRDYCKIICKKMRKTYTEAVVVGLKRGMEILKMLRGHVDMTL